ncbi:hypothetical protein LCGC14_1896320 [marine sediment metagenome]|uniref:Uncharacterized protein n=1 Tax=marine sediment metagenome TaxID=412755 RepID=A0A0F9GLD1_9ZZZZ
MDQFEKRTSRSDEGVLALIDAVFKDIFGLNDETASRIMKMIKNQGQWQDLKVSVRTLSGVAYRRLNDVINMAQQRDGIGDTEEFSDDFDQEPDKDPEQASWEQTNWDNDRVREGMSFVGYLLAELQYSDADLRDPQKKQEITRLMRAGPAQADQLITRAEKDQSRNLRQAVQQETDPQRINLQRKKQQLQKQIAQIDQQLGEPGEVQVQVQPQRSL